MKNINKGVIYCIIGALAIGFGNVAGKLATQNINPLVLSTLTTIVVFITSWLLVFILRLNLRKIYFRKFWFWYLASGVIQVTATLLTISGLKYTLATNVSFLLRIEVFLAIVFGIFIFKEKINIKQLGGIIIAFIGAYIFTTQFKFHINFGDFLVILGALSWSLGSVTAKKIVEGNVSPFIITSVRFLISITIFLFIILITGQSLSFPTNQILNIFLYAFLISFLAFTLFVYSLKLLDLWKATFIFQFFAVIFGAFLAWLFLKENLTLIQWSGGVLILIGIFMITLLKSSQKINKFENENKMVD